MNSVKLVCSGSHLARHGGNNLHPDSIARHGGKMMKVHSESQDQWSRNITVGNSG